MPNLVRIHDCFCRSRISHTSERNRLTSECVFLRGRIKFTGVSSGRGVFCWFSVFVISASVSCDFRLKSELGNLFRLFSCQVYLLIVVVVLVTCCVGCWESLPWVILDARFDGGVTILCSHPFSIAQFRWR